ncbi:MAG: WecB/TagA/CpsF family glycosyltransferase [Firmicutes bacterium]|nr:WecB/TagA/CpsF family glycosyltransferase [Bacillota bacterium]
MGKQYRILGVPFDVLTMTEAVLKVMEMMKGDKQRIICTPNPEIVVEAQSDKELMGILNQADMVVMDGTGITWAYKKLTGEKAPRIAGYDLVQEVFSAMSKTDYTAYFFGGKPGIAKKAAINMRKKYPGLKIVGFHDGYFTSAEEMKLILELKRLSPDFLLVGLGAPKQEKWIYNNIRLTGAKIGIGVGGCFDVMSGEVKRAPETMQKMKLEWFYRLIKQPTRAGRMMRLPKFVSMVNKSKRK